MTLPQTHDTSSLPPYLQGLNPVQLEAATSLEGPVLILAGAGTGKTRVLTTRLAHLLISGKAYPSQILAVTFTNKAALEMKERVSKLLGGQPVEGWWLGTFHAIAARMLRRHADLVGLTPQFSILDSDDQLRLLKQILEAQNVDSKKWPAKLVLSVIERWKDRGLRPDDLGPKDAGEVADGKMLSVYQTYQNRLKTINACDFGDLMLHMIGILRSPQNSHILAEYHKKFRYILVDEYQDTNVVQYLWLRLLAQGSGNLCCVGDDDQSIYGWRGAEVGNILRFEKDFPGCKTIRLEQNYRSTGHILAAASGVIANNAGRLGKTLWCAGDSGEKILLRGLWDGEAEARWVAEEIEQLQQKRWSLRQVAVLVRAGFQMREFEERFLQLGLPYRVFGGPRFYERQEIRDALAYFRVVVQNADDLAFERIINLPKRGIGESTIQTLYALSRPRGMSLFQACAELCETDELRPKVRATLQNLLQDFARWGSLLPTMKHTDLAAQILDQSGYMAMWQTDKSPEAAGRVENLKELVAGMEEFESLPAFLEHVALVMETQNAAIDEDYVSLMTLHGAKGLEFDAVFLPGWEEGLFPSQRTMDETGLSGLEEERRLAYVGLTRARKRAFVSYAANRRMYGNWINAIPSRFVDELPEAHVEVAAETGLYNPGRSVHWDSSGFTPKRAAPEVLSSPPIRMASGNPHGFKVGSAVSHEKFGTGRVVHIVGNKLDIKFKDGTTKRVIDSFVKLED
ncbi:MAG: UvrD-helicase domain-containing protein [Alphaproteobacteria bacterium]|jgi:DNA helicase-2/ATP-dependent DNA helicase PcrA|nr:UvrD-helicase domain-containing protein [Alphaproteobacteria bacterium]MBP9868782.1 UvrD-helicase domain-containing protein [Alphaproteobacteria bacterium]